MPLSEDVNNTDPLRFVKTGHAPLSQKALEQMRMASEQADSWVRQRLKAQEEEETEDWQSKLANWKDRRRQQMPRKSIDAGTPAHAVRETDASSEKDRDAVDCAEKISQKIAPEKIKGTRDKPQNRIRDGSEPTPPAKIVQRGQCPKPQPPPKPYPKPQPKLESQQIQRVQNYSGYPPQAAAPPVILREEERRNGWGEESGYSHTPPVRRWGSVWQQHGQFEENTLTSSYEGGIPQYPLPRPNTQEGKCNGNYVQNSSHNYVPEKLYGSSSYHEGTYDSTYSSSWKSDYNEAEYYGHQSRYAPAYNSRVREPLNNIASSDDYDPTVTTTTTLLSEFSCEPRSRKAAHFKDKWSGMSCRLPKREEPQPSQQEQIPDAPDDLPLSVSGRQRCSHCRSALGHGAAMVIESLGLIYHLECFRCCVCSTPLGNGRRGTDVRVRNTKLHCCNCYSNDEAGLQLSRV